MIDGTPSVSPTSLLPFAHSDALLTSLLESSPLGTALINMSGVISYANPTFRQMLGFEERDATGFRIEDLIHGDHVASASAQAGELIAGRVDGYRAERRFHRRDGSTFWALVSTSVLRNERTGAPICLVVQMTDIDRQRRTENELAAIESRWNLALEGAGQGVWDHNIRAGTMFYSRMWRLMRGFGPDEEVNGAIDEWLKRVHPDDRERLRSIVIRQDLGEIPYNAFEYRERHRAGHYIWILSRGRPVEWFPDGLPARIVGTDTDITNLKHAEGELADEKERLNVTLSSIGDGVISTDADGRVTFMNPTAEEMTGWRSGDAEGEAVATVFNIINEKTRAPAPNPVAMCMSQQRPVQFDDDVTLVGRDGRRTHIRDSAAPVRTRDGRTIGAVLVFQDMTQNRAQQQKLAHSAAHDALTGLPNRQAFERALTSACASVAQEKRTHAICFIDLDRFKRVNDTAGHAAGDALLRRVGEAISANRRSQDFVARFGGDEFALILSDCPLDAAEQIAQQVIDAIAGIRFTWQGRDYSVGASIGVAGIGQGEDDPNDAINRADRACYAAKNGGRNLVVIWGRETPALRASA